MEKYCICVFWHWAFYPGTFHGKFTECQEIISKLELHLKSFFFFNVWCQRSASPSDLSVTNDFMHGTKSWLLHLARTETVLMYFSATVKQQVFLVAFWGKFCLTFCIQKLNHRANFNHLHNCKERSYSQLPADLRKTGRWRILFFFMVALFFNHLLQPHKGNQ